MELFYSKDIDGSRVFLGTEESAHCIRVLRHRAGDEINVIDGEGTLYRCRIADDSPKGAVAEIVSGTGDWGGHPYHLTMAVAPTKNIDRYEWFAEKACEIGVDEVVPVIGEHSERRVIKGERLEKILVSAAKQSLKAKVPVLHEAVSVKDFISETAPRAVGGGTGGTGTDNGTLKLIAYCFEDGNVPRRSMKEVLEGFDGDRVTVMIGPEGDFSREEAELAVRHGFIPVHLGASRLRTETAAIVATTMVYIEFTGKMMFNKPSSDGATGSGLCLQSRKDEKVAGKFKEFSAFPL